MTSLGSPSSGRVARNATLSLTTSIVPALVGLLTVPYLIRGLGAPAFGVLAICWVVLGMFAILDFGAGRATARRVAEAQARGRHHEVGDVLWTAVAVASLVGVLAAALMAATSAGLVRGPLEVPAELRGDAATALRLLALSVPPILVAGVGRSALEGAQRFDLVSLVQLPAGVANFLLPALAVALGGGLPLVVALLCGSRFLVAPAFLACCLRVLPGSAGIRVCRAQARYLMGFGGWTTVSSVVGAVLLSADRLLVGALLGVTSVAAYAPPYELVSRLTLLPSSLMAALFPALAARAAMGREQLRAPYLRATRHILLLVAPISAVLVVFADDILRIWLGSAFSDTGTDALRLLAVGLLFLSLGSLPFNLLQAEGRPGVAARLHLLELLPYLALAWLLVSRFGVVGAAAAWSCRVAADYALFHLAVMRTLPAPRGTPPALRSPRARATAVILVSCVAVLGLLSFGPVPLAARLGVLGAVALAYGWSAWHFVLDEADRVVLRRLAGARRAASSTGR